MLLMLEQSFQSIGEEGAVWQHDGTRSLGAGPWPGTVILPHTASFWTQHPADLLYFRPPCSNLYSGTAIVDQGCPPSHHTPMHL